MLELKEQSCFARTFDVAIVGSGYAGYAAATELHQRGEHVLLLDRQGDLLWESGRAFAVDVVGTSDAPAWRALQREFTERGAASEDLLDGAAAELVASAQLLRHDVPTLYYVAPVAVEMVGDMVGALVVATKSGLRRIFAHRWIDATESAELLQLVSPDQAVSQPPERRWLNVFLQHHEWPTPLPAAVPAAATHPAMRFSFHPTQWPGERRLSIELTDALDVATAVLAGLEALHAHAPDAVKDAVVSHSSTLAYPIYETAPPSLSTPQPANLAVAATRRKRLVTLAERFELGLSLAEAMRKLPKATLSAEHRDAPVASVEPTRELSADVAVVGAGTGGAIAAIAAARSGAKVVCLDPLAFPGGMGAVGGVHRYYYGVPGGLQVELDNRVKETMRLFGSIRQVRGFHPDAKKFTLLQMMHEAGVRFLPHTTAAAPRVENGRITSLLVSRPGAVWQINAPAWIDGTGDGDLCAAAGAAYRLGRQGDGLLHAYTQAVGRINRNEGPGQAPLTIRGSNHDAGWVDPTDPEDLSRARLAGVVQHLADRFDNTNRPTYVAPAIGLRQGRSIETDYTLTLADLIERRAFQDLIGFTGSHYDVHEVDFEFQSDEGLFWIWFCRQWRRRIACQMPYRMLLPRGLDNVWIACRALGASEDAQFTCRMQRDMQRVGEAAGYAAALAVRHQGAARKVPFDALQQQLAQTGAIDITQADAEVPFNEAVTESDSFHTPITDRQIEQGLAALEGGAADPAIWYLYRAGERVRESVLSHLTADSPHVSWLAAGVCAMWGDARAEPRLIEAITSREFGFHVPSSEELAKQNRKKPNLPQTNRRLMPNWLTAIAMLRCCGSDRCLPALADVAAQPGLLLNVRTTIALTLERLLDAGRLDDAQRVARITDNLLVEPIPGRFVMPDRNIASLLTEPDPTTFAAGPTGRLERSASLADDHCWQLHLVIARIHQSLQIPTPFDWQAYLHDQRAIVRHAFSRIEGHDRPAKRKTSYDIRDERGGSSGVGDVMVYDRPLVFEKRYQQPVPISAWWQSRMEQIHHTLGQVRQGTVRERARSNGGHPVHVVTYGEPEPALRGKANFNAAVAAGSPDAYWRRDERTRPVMVILAGVHGAEVEGMMGAMSVLSLMEHGVDLQGQAQPSLLEKLQRLRLLVVPLANPDGRLRVPYDGWVGLPSEEMHRVNQGTRKDGSLYGWPGCKAVHPMTGDVGGLGAYFDDRGINLMHDEPSAPMSPVTAALLQLVREEGPDTLLNLHSHPLAPDVHDTHYIPIAVRRELRDWTQGLYERYAAVGLPHFKLRDVGLEGESGQPEPSFNLNSAFYHAGAALPFTFESPHGLDDPRGPKGYGYAELLQTHHVLFEAAADHLLSRRVSTSVAN